MAKKTITHRSQAEIPPSAEIEIPTGPTGRFLVTMSPGSQRSLIKSLKDIASIEAATTADFEKSENALEGAGNAGALIFEYLNIAVISGEDAEKIQSLEMAVADDSSSVMAVEPEEYVQALSDDGYLTAAGRAYLRGYRDGVLDWSKRMLGEEEEIDGEPAPAQTYADNHQFTWGLQATRVNTSSATGAGIRVAVLDTGMDLAHPDFAGRAMIHASFIAGQPVQDLHSHGTHCVGTVAGDRQRAGGMRRYGCARESIILAGKVLSNQGSGQDAGILAGINWAIQKGARVISMSLGSPVAVGQTHKVAYENAGRAALNAGSLIIAAAGNSGSHPQYYPVGSPANAPSIMAVAAVDQSLRRASFSCRGVNPNGGELDIAGPGVDVFSSVPMAARYGLKSGTSMATPHVAGIAALWAQRTGLRGAALRQRLLSSSLNIGQSAQLVGRGLVQAPQ